MFKTNFNVIQKCTEVAFILVFGRMGNLGMQILEIRDLDVLLDVM